MEISEFNKTVKNKMFRNLYFFCGEEEYLKELYIGRLIDAAVDESSRSFNFFVFKEQCEIKDIVSSVENVPVFSEKKVVYLDNLELFKRDASFRDALTECVGDLPPYTILIIREKKTDEKTKLGKAIKKNGEIIKCDYPSDSDMRAFIASQFKKQGKKISVSNANKIISECERDMNTVVNLISSVSSYMKESEEVTEEILDKFIIRSINSEIYYFTDSVVEGRAKDAYEIMKSLLLKPGVNEHSLFTSLSMHISSLYIIRCCENANIWGKNMLKYLGKMPPFLLTKYQRQQKSIPPRLLSELVSLCAEYEYKMKSGLIRNISMPIYIVISKLSAGRNER